MNLNINYDSTRSLGNQLISRASDLKQQLNNIRNINSQISQFWGGADANKYFATSNEQLQYMMQLVETINETGNYLIRVANAYEQAAQNNSSSIF